MAAPFDKFEAFTILSDELQMLVVKAVSLSALGNLRLTCHKMNKLAQICLFRELQIPVEEDYSTPLLTLKVMPGQIILATSLTILNRPKPTWDTTNWYDDIVPRRCSDKRHRWHLQDQGTECLSYIFMDSALCAGSQFNWHVKLQPNQLVTFKWLHAIPLAVEEGIIKTLIKQSRTLKHLELSMIEPVRIAIVMKMFSEMFAQHKFQLRTFIHRGLSYTEPLPRSGQSAGDRFRMIRPLVKDSFSTLRTLVLTQEHCISQIGRTPLVNGYTFESTLCDLDEIYICPTRSLTQETIVLRPSNLELGGFDVGRLASTVPIALGPKVRIEIPTLRRLVLSDCHGVDKLLAHLISRGPLKQIHLKEFGIRFENDALRASRRRQAAAMVVPFLMSFTGLETLSIMCKKPVGVDLSRQVLRHHEGTLRVLVNDAREATASEFQTGLQSTHPFVQQPCDSSDIWALLSDETNTLPVAFEVQEIGLPLKQELEHAALQSLSCYPSLRTVHIRNFVTKDSSLWSDNKNRFLFWRNPDGSVPAEARQAARAMVESITSQVDHTQHSGSMTPCAASVAAQDTARMNMLRKYNKLFGTKHGSQPPDSDSFSTTWLDLRTELPKDVVHQIAKHKSECDAEFAMLMSGIQNGVATNAMWQSYQLFAAHVHRCLGIIPSVDRPQLQLLIIGDWRYRDRFNLAGPRTWDPDAWYILKKPRDSDDDEFLFLDGEDSVESDDGSGIKWNEHMYKLPTTFDRHFSTLTVPIFFKVNWRQKENEAARWEWEADPEPIEYSAVKDDGDFAIRSLDFAWQS